MVKGMVEVDMEYQLDYDVGLINISILSVWTLAVAKWRQAL